ncbi:hypothetical protein [Devosia sp. Root436]|uniref:hypothetical protein n=1 Tax=Devosia sp. Root436 TaxID=1736537 RepID=UPI000A583AE4|nr:hypothetical protein [Devosia sp. Root436]
MAKSIHLAVAAAATLAAASALPVSASEIQDAYRAHTRLCIGLFFTDKDAHTELCLPNTSGNSPAHETSGGPVVAPPPPPPVVVVVTPPPPPPGCTVVQTNCGPVCNYPA